MPIPVSRLVEKHGLSPQKLKAAFDVSTMEKRQPVKKLVDKIRDCVREGLDRNRRDYRLYKAMDWAMDQPFYQVSYTQLRGLLTGKPDDKKVMETVNSWGLTHLLPQKYENGRACCDQAGNPVRVLNLPFLTNIYVPIVMAYHNIRLAKLFNDRNLDPLYKYEPTQFTKENRLKCDFVTQVVKRQSAWFDYKADERQSISQMLQYGFCINFPREAWYSEKQLDGEGKEKIVREGLRFNMPHPSRMYFDGYHRLSTLNSNSGCEYAGNWALERYANVEGNPLYWNKDKIAIGAHGWLDIGKTDFLEQVYPCAMSFPSATDDGIGGAGALNRENDAARFYSTGTSNSATLVTNHFHRIIPKDHGLGDYKYPVWFRFVFASDNAVVWAEPLAYDVFPTYAYDADFNRSRFRSLTLEVMPFQDQIGNLLSQWGMAVRENLRNPVFVDSEKVPSDALVALQNHGNKTYSGREYIPYSSTVNYRMKTDQREAFFTPTMTKHDTGEIARLITGVLDMLDRVMQLSPQEIGQAASHEQTAEESRIVASNMSTRVAFTGSFIDDAIYAKKRMIYDATMEYADDDITVGISSAYANTEEELKKLAENLGVTLFDDTAYNPDNPKQMRTGKIKKSALTLETFASQRDADSRIDNPALADAMSKIFISIANNPVLIQSIGAVQLVELLNQIVVAAGLPKEFRLHAQPVKELENPEAQSNQLAEEMKAFAEQIRTLIDQTQQQTLEAAGQQTQQIVGQAMEAVVQQVQPVVQGVEQVAQLAGQATQVNQQQQQQMEQLAAMMAQLNEKIEATAQATAMALTATSNQQAQQAQPVIQPMNPAAPVGVPV